MRFERIEARRFGGLADLDTGAEALPDLVVFSGPNEAGKSTFFRLLTSILYGFSPANRDTNRDAPWGGEDADAAALLRMDDGDVLQVRRKLMSAPWGRITRDGHERDIRNRPLEQLERLPRTVFRQVFALTLAEVAGLEVGSWAEVQDRLVNAMGARDIIAPRDAADQLDDEAGALWRPNRRGNQVVRQLGDRIRDVERARDAATARDLEIRDLDARIRKARVELRDLKASRAEIEETERRVARLHPVHRQLQRIAQLRAEAGDRLDDVPSEPERRLTGLREREAVVSMRVQELGGLDAGIRENLRRARSICSDLLGRAWTPADRHALRRISAVALRHRVRDYLEARDARRIAEARAPTPTRVSAARPLDVDRRAALLGGLGLVGLAGGLGAGMLWITIVGAVALSAAIVRAVRLRRPSRDLPAGPTETGSRPVDTLVEAERQAQAAVRRAMGALEATTAVLEQPTLELPGLIQRLQELDRDLEAQVVIALDATPVTEEASEPPSERQLSLGFSGPDPVPAPQAPGSPSVARHDEALARLEAARAAALRDLETAERARRELEKRLALLGDGDPERGLRVAETRRAAARTADELAAELERSHEDLEDVRAEIARAVASDEVWTREADALAALQRQRADLTKRVESLGRSLERDAQTIARLRDLPTADQLEGEVLVLREERRRRAAERDRKVLLAHLIRAADQQFRSERQPRVLRRAGEYLAHVTGGRYDRFVTGEQDDREVFRLAGRRVDQAPDLETGVSTGTREQAYLALRLAAVDELDDGGERIPIFIDEVFVNWDAARRERGIDLLGRLAARRQVFAFTCHDDVAGELERVGGRVVTLEEGRLRSLEGAW